MNRDTIDFGIDLGTTNSAVVALNGVRTDIVKNNDDNDITPSAVYINKHGQVHTGIRAKFRLGDVKSTDDVYVEFKRRMGTDHDYKFKSSGQVMSPVQLSAEMLKGLRGDVQQRLGEDMNSAVITVPAAFEQKQCAATRTAGELAGLYQCPLVQEPVAAALAYGYQSDVTNENWLIYDFGGGTFDAAIMKAEDGTINVVNHGGDNYLGGSDIDWTIIEKLIIPAIQSEFKLPDFRRGNPQWRTALALVKRSVESAKIQLSRSDSTFLEGCCFRDADGEEVEFDYKLTRNALVSVAEPLIMQSVDICKRVLKEKNLTPNAIEKVVLVGGPTLAPYFREILQDSLGIKVDFSVDPLTVVGRGAAVFAGTQRLKSKSTPKIIAGQYELDLRYQPVGADEDPTVRGAIKVEDGQSIQGFTVEFVNQLTHWRSGKVPVKNSGHFRVDLLAEKGDKNPFSIELLDETGKRQVCIPDSISYTMGLAISEQPVIHNLAVAMANNEADVFIKKGDPLPAKATRVYRSSHAVQKGSQDDILNVPVIEGDLESADRNSLLGKLMISGAQVRRDVPAGSEIEVTLHLDESRILKAKAYIPILDEEYEAVIEYAERSPDPLQLKREHEEELARLDSLREKAIAADDSNAENQIDQIDVQNRMEALEREVNAAEADSGAAGKAEAELLKVKVELDRVEQSLKWPSTVVDAENALGELERLVDEYAPEHRNRLNTLQIEIEGLIEEKRAEPLKKKMEQVTELHREILFAQPGFWVGFLNDLIADRAKMTDQAGADRLINQGQQFMQQGNVDGLRRVVVQLLGLLPQEAAEAIQRGYQSGLLK